MHWRHMTYFPDLTQYVYWSPEDMYENVLTVGWLDIEHEFPTGKVDRSLLDKLLIVTNRERTNLTRGAHFCPWCALEKWGGTEPPTFKDLRGVPGSSAEVWILGKNGIIYAAPKLLHHYIEIHDYLPP